MSPLMQHIIEKISIIHLNILLLLGLALFGGMIGGRVFQKLRIPQVMGYIVIGILLGQSGLKMVDDATILALRPFNYFALGLIGFMIGAELKREIFMKYGKNFLYILLWEGVTPFILVLLFVGIGGGFIFGFSNYIWALGLLLGSIASATDPATTTAVLKEYRTRGPLTSNIIGVVALDDGLALLLFAVASSVVSMMVGSTARDSVKIAISPLYEIGGAVAIGIFSGIILSKILSRYGEKERILTFTIGMVLLVTGLALALHVSMLLAVMTMGVVVVNVIPKKSEEAIQLVDGFTSPIYVLFFVLVGIKLKLNYVTHAIIFLVAIYLLCGMSGKMLGAFIGSRLSRAPYRVIRYLPFALFSQAGVAIGLSILAAQYFPGEIGNNLIIIVTLTTLFTQIIGPPFTKFAVSKAEEIGLNITEEDIIKTTKVKDVMDSNPPIIYEDMHIRDILKLFSEYENLYYPVTDRQKKLRGIITVDEIKQAFLEKDIGELVLAFDLMEPVLAKTEPGAGMSEVNEILSRYNIDYLPVVDGDDILVGFIERKRINKFVSTRLIQLQERRERLSFDQK